MPLIGDQADNDAASYRLRRFRHEAGDELGDMIDLCTPYPEARRTIVRFLAEVDAAGRRVLPRSTPPEPPPRPFRGGAVAYMSVV